MSQELTQKTERIHTTATDRARDFYDNAYACERTLIMYRIAGGVLAFAPFFSCFAMVNQQTVPRRSPMFMSLVALTSGGFAVAGASVLGMMEPIIREKQRATQLADQLKTTQEQASSVLLLLKNPEYSQSGKERAVDQLSQRFGFIQQ